MATAASFLKVETLEPSGKFVQWKYRIKTSVSKVDLILDGLKAPPAILDSRNFRKVADSKCKSKINIDSLFGRCNIGKNPSKSWQG